LESAQARWVKVPTSFKDGCWAIKKRSFKNSCGLAPRRFMPVSSLAWTRAMVLARVAARTSSRASVREERVMVRRC